MDNSSETLSYFKENNRLSFGARLILFRHSAFFTVITTVMIIVYSILLGFSTTEYAKNHFVATSLIFADYLVTSYFVIEILLKLYAEKNKIDFFKDYWNVFDFVIVAISLVPLNSTNVLMSARLLRVFRVLKLVAANKDLQKIISALGAAIPAIFNIIVLMFILFYIYAVIGTTLFFDAKSGLWVNIPISMLTLFRVLTFEDWTDVMYEAMDMYPYAWIYFVSFVFINAFVVFNLFVAVIIDEIDTIKKQNVNTTILKNKITNEMLMAEIVYLRNEITQLKEK